MLNCRERPPTNIIYQTWFRGANDGRNNSGKLVKAALSLRPEHQFVFHLVRDVTEDATHPIPEVLPAQCVERPSTVRTIFDCVLPSLVERPFSAAVEWLSDVLVVHQETIL